MDFIEQYTKTHGIGSIAQEKQASPEFDFGAVPLAAFFCKENVEASNSLLCIQESANVNRECATLTLLQALPREIDCSSTGKSIYALRFHRTCRIADDGVEALPMKPPLSKHDIH